VRPLIGAGGRDMKSFQQIQQQFIAHIKDPQNNPAIEGIEDRRLAIYRELFFNNINGFVSSGFPVLKTLFSEDDWTEMVRDFFIKHDCQSPYFIDIAKEFVDYLINEKQASDDDLPFLVELAHYEWVELDVSVRREKHHYQWISLEDIELVPMVLSETAWPLSYSFPVHQISTGFMPTQGVPGSVHLIVYRDEAQEVQFMLINGVTAMLLQILAANPGLVFDTLVEALIVQLPQFEDQQISSGATQVIEKLVARGIIRAYQGSKGGSL
jgi:hypothetical protein